MSESGDSTILADIKALEEALDLDIKYQETEEEQSDSDELKKVDDENDYLDENRNIDPDEQSLNAYEINKRLIVGLTIAKNKIIALLRSCEEKIKQLDEEMINSTDVPSLRIRYPISILGMPYFKDKNNFPAPKNEDTKLKESRGELLLLSLKKPIRWSEKDRDILLRAVHNEAIESVLSFNGESDEASARKKQDDQIEKSKLALPKSLNELVGALGERKFDWYKISVIDFDNKHSPEECQAMWNVYLHPEIKKTEWTTMEDKKLLRCAKQYRYQDWDTITLKLATNRSAYQCFIRYNTIKKVPSVGRAWSKAEDKHLIRIIDSLKIGDYIPWSEIAGYLWHRTKQQIYSRWMYRKAPHLRKGRFSEAETETLLEAMKKYGKNFSKISNAIMPSRTSIQLSEHYCTLMRNKDQAPNVWTADDDIQVIKMHTNFGNNWSKIARYMPHKTRTQVRHRYNQLVKYAKKGVSIDSIPRQPSASHTSTNKNLVLKYCDKSTSDELDKLLIIDDTDIHLRLYETFTFPISTRSVDSQNDLYDFEQLECETKKLYNILNLLSVDLNVPYNYLNYVHVDRREKQLLMSFKKYVQENNNKIEDDKIEDDKMLEILRLRMFGNDQSGDGNSSFIPPIPFCGYTYKTRNLSKTPQFNIDCIIDLNNKFLSDAITEFPTSVSLEPFVNIEESNLFDKFSEFLTKKFHYKYNISFNTLNIECTQIEQSSNSEIKHFNADEHFNADNLQKAALNNIVLPNRATLLGFKNLLLWKLLYEYDQSQSGKSSSLKKDDENSDLTTYSKQSDEYKRAYELLRTRLYQLFKFPITMSNTTLEIFNPDVITLPEKVDLQTLIKISRKRKHENINSVQPNKRDTNNKINILADSNFRQNTNIKTAELPMIRSSKVICKKYKIITK